MGKRVKHIYAKPHEHIRVHRQHRVRNQKVSQGNSDAKVILYVLAIGFGIFFIKEILIALGIIVGVFVLLLLIRIFCK